MSEIDLHRSVADFLDWIVLPPAVWTTFPAGWTAMRRGAAGRLKGCGLKAGMPDILVFHGGKTFGFELKTLSGKLSQTQKDTFNRLRIAGISVDVVYNIFDLHELLYLYKIPMRKFSHGQSFKTPEGRRPQEPAQGARGTAA